MENPKIKILSFHKIFHENAIILSKRTGFPLILGDYKPEENDIIIVFGSHENIAGVLDILNAFKSIKCILIQSEQIQSQFLQNKYYLTLLRLARVFVFDWSYQNAMDLQRRYQVTVRSIYTWDYFSRCGDEPWEDRPIDICFIGSPNPKRQFIINTMKQQYPNLKFLIDFNWSFNDQNKLANTLKRCKFVLNIPYHQDSALETHRINRAISCGCRVITQRSRDDDLNEIYKPYVYFTNTYHNIIDKYLEKKLEPTKNYEDFVKNVLSKTLHNNGEVIKKVIEATIE